MHRFAATDGQLALDLTPPGHATGDRATDQSGELFTLARTRSVLTAKRDAGSTGG
jgi:hypothetical protein